MEVTWFFTLLPLNNAVVLTRSQEFERFLKLEHAPVKN